MNFQGRDEQNFLNGLHNALGVDSWSYADFSVITGLRKNRTDDKSQLATASASYVRDPAMAGIKLRSLTEGRVQPLADGGLFVEETNVGRHLRFSATKLMWSRINYYDARRIGLVTWSRYLTSQEGEALARAVASRCGQPQPAATGDR